MLMNSNVSQSRRRRVFSVVSALVVWMVLGGVPLRCSQAEPTNVWSTQTIGSFFWNDATHWTNGFGPPANGNSVLITNVISLNNSRNVFLTNDNPTLLNLVISNPAAAAVRIQNLILSNSLLSVTGTTVIGSNAVVQVGKSSGAAASSTFSNNNLYLDSNAKIIFDNGSGALVQSLLVGGIFTNSTQSQIANIAGNSSVLMQFLDATKIVTNRGTFAFWLAGAGATLTMQVGSSATPGLFVNQGTTATYLGGASATKSYTFSNYFMNAGQMVVSNGGSSASAITFTTFAYGFTNAANGTVTLVSSNGGAGVRVAITNSGTFLNQGTVAFTASPDAATRSNNAILVALTPGGVFSNDVSGQVIVTSANTGTNLIRADRIVNLGANLVNGGTLLYQTSTGGNGILENSGLITLNNGNLVAAGNITNTSQGTIRTTTGVGTLASSVVNYGTIAANGGTLFIGSLSNRAGSTISGSGTFSFTGAANLVLSSGSTLAPGPGLSQLTVNGSVSFDSNATFSVELSLVDGTSDRLVITQGLTLDGNSILNIAGGVAGNIYTVATFNVSSLLGTFGTVTPGYTVGYDNAGGALTLTVVPEPSALVLAAAGLLGLVMLLKRRS